MTKRAFRWQATLAAVVIWGGFCTVNVLAEQGLDTSAKPPARSVSEFVTPDGRLDLESARLSGFERSLDLDDVNLQFDPRTGESRVRPLTALTPTDDPDDIYWDNSISPSIPGVGGGVYAAVVYEGQLVVGGGFGSAGDQIVQDIAVRNGNNWSSLGLGMDGVIEALIVYDGKLIAGGQFTTAGGVEVNYIASWDGSSWSALGSGMDSHVYALAVYDGKLIAGGWFWTAGGDSTNCVASWDGLAWSPLGSGIGGPLDIYSYVLSLAVFDGKLIAGGKFTAAGGVEANRIASWDGSSWSSLGSGIVDNNVPYVSTLAVYDERLVAGGYFYSAGGVSAPNIASWDGAVWSPMGSGTDGYVEALQVYDGNLIVGGYFNNAGGVWVSGIAAWNGSDWSPLGSGLWGEALALTVFNGNLIAGGGFTTAGDAAALCIASWNGNNWSALGSGINSYVSALTEYDGKLIVGGAFAAVGDIAANRVASWDGVNWEAMGSGMSSLSGWSSSIRTFAVCDGNLIAGGDFAYADGILVNRIASWNGSNWAPMGAGVAEPVRALLLRDGKLIAGEASAGAASVVSWDGIKWTELGARFNRGVLALAEYDGKLIAGGWFTEAGGVEANYIAAWDGISWSPLGSGIGYYDDNTSVGALAVYDGKLIVAGSFSSAGGVTAWGIASWDGVSWQSMGDYMGGYMGGYYGEWPSFIVYDGKLILDDAAWDGTVWSTLGSGVNGQAMAHSIYDDKLIVGGSFTVAGNKVSCRLAMWTKVTTDVAEYDGSNLPDVVSVVQNYPNPFNPATTIEYNVPSRTQVTIEIFNVLGQKVRTLVNEMKSAGSYSTEWDGIDDAGKPVSTGVYLYRFSAGDAVQTKKMVLLK